MMESDEFIIIDSYEPEALGSEREEKENEKVNNNKRNEGDEFNKKEANKKEANKEREKDVKENDRHSFPLDNNVVFNPSLKGSFYDEYLREARDIINQNMLIEKNVKEECTKVNNALDIQRETYENFTNETLKKIDSKVEDMVFKFDHAMIITEHALDKSEKTMEETKKLAEKMRILTEKINHILNKLEHVEEENRSLKLQLDEIKSNNTRELNKVILIN